MLSLYPTEIPKYKEKEHMPEPREEIQSKFDFDIGKVIVALDKMSIGKANDLISNYYKDVYGFKVNHLLYGYVRKYRRNIFVDYKLHDIPNTMNLVVERAIKQKASMITVHMSNSESAFKQLSKYSGHIKLLGVTALTSLSDDDCKAIYNKSLEEAFERSIDLMIKNEFWGAICSPQDLKYFSHAKHLKKICPGIQINPMNNDQVRTATPQEAFDNGADYLVMGRAFLERLDENFQQRH